MLGISRTENVHENCRKQRNRAATEFVTTGPRIRLRVVRQDQLDAVGFWFANSK